MKPLRHYYWAGEVVESVKCLTDMKTRVWSLYPQGVYTYNSSAGEAEKEGFPGFIRLSV